jgi:hypothetical protein
MTLDTDLLWQAWNTRQTPTLSKAVFTECQALDEMRRTANGHQQPSIVDDCYLCRVSGVDTRQNNFFVECPLEDTQQINYSSSAFFWHSTKYIFVFFAESLCRVPDKKYSAKKSLAMYNSPRLFWRKSHSAKSFSIVYHSTKQLFPVV